jgi:hypothetical protein
MALPPPEFERKARRTAAWTVVAALLFYAVALRMAVFAYGPVLGFVVCTPVLAGYASWLLLHNGSAGLSVMKWLALRRINGQRHFFDEHAIDVRTVDGRCRVAARDVLAALGETGGPRMLHRLRVQCGPEGFFEDEDGHWWFDEAAILQWLDASGRTREHRTQRLRLWLEREVFPVLRRREERRGTP